MHARTLETAQWWARPRGPENTAWVGNYQRSTRARQRDLISRLVGEIGGETLLEVGAHCGPNLVRLAEDHPGLRLIGVDVNVEAVEGGRAWARTRGLADRIQLNAGTFPGLTDGLASGSFDLVLSCYALAYIAPPDLPAALYEMGRLAATAVILAEPMQTGEAETTETRALSGYTEWQHNYGVAARWIASLQGVTATWWPVTPPVDRLNGVLVLQRCRN